MKERPIIFSGPMVRAILDGRKTQTRRVVKPQPPTVEAVRTLSGDNFSLFTDGHANSSADFRVAGPVWAVRELCGQQEWRCPYGKPGDRLWVRETWMRSTPDHIIPGFGMRKAIYKTDDDADVWGDAYKWRPSIHMPRWASRIMLEVTGVRVERLQDVSEEDSIAEGSQTPVCQLPESCRQGCLTERTQFSRIWDSINGKKYPWGSNPWVWVIEFKRIGAAE